MTCGLLLASLASFAQTPMWNDPGKNYDNRLDNVSNYFAYETETAAQKGKKTDSKRYMSIEGTWKFNWAENANERPQGFEALNYDDSKWGTMPVPGNWEMNGYGEAIYVNNQYAWRHDWATNPPFVQDKNNHVGSYRKTFRIPADWKGDKIYMHIGSATSNITVYINGKYVTEGPAQSYHMHYPYNEIDVTAYLTSGENTFAVLTYYHGLICNSFVSGDLRQMLWLDLALDGETVLVSDESWRCGYHTGYTECGRRKEWILTPDGALDELLYQRVFE